MFDAKIELRSKLLLPNLVNDDQQVCRMEVVVYVGGGLHFRKRKKTGPNSCPDFLDENDFIHIKQHLVLAKAYQVAVGTYSQQSLPLSTQG